jgi:hypothetical protein
MRARVLACNWRRVWAWLGPTIAFVAVVGSVWVSSYEGRVNLIHAQRQACQRGKLDRAANARGWRDAEQARRASGTPTDLRAAREYAALATGLEARSRIDCTRAFPDTSFLEFR